MDILADIEEEEGEGSPPIVRRGPSEMDLKKIESVNQKLKSGILQDLDEMIDEINSVYDSIIPEVTEHI
jgi:hypothetical protein